jgi:hypothetical protein
MRFKHSISSGEVFDVYNIKISKGDPYVKISDYVMSFSSVRTLYNKNCLDGIYECNICNKKCSCFIVKENNCICSDCYDRYEKIFEESYLIFNNQFDHLDNSGFQLISKYNDLFRFVSIGRTLFSSADPPEVVFRIGCGSLISRPYNIYIRPSNIRKFILSFSEDGIVDKLDSDLRLSCIICNEKKSGEVYIINEPLHIREDSCNICKDCKESLIKNIESFVENNKDIIVSEGLF